MYIVYGEKDGMACLRHGVGVPAISGRTLRLLMSDVVHVQTSLGRRKGKQKMNEAKKRR